ncbi:uncharacterized protein DNG_05689 [Cephalotrichum gorgonifer]|uniref:Myb-like domain-containing protein n=1 Tax=Cephalotrichum gorgonifer TaxID=2041049 RepID=A0AAE8N0X4_9PEZI|nr:uncharacterized protein DNG_05689 [Cephalotrichum gorgonifer]
MTKAHSAALRTKLSVGHKRIAYILSALREPQPGTTATTVATLNPTIPISQKHLPLSPPNFPERVPLNQILSIQSPATVQSGSLWRNPCIGGTLAGNYRVGDYNVDYSTQEPHPGEQNQQQHTYESPAHQQQQQQHQHQHPHQQHQPPLHHARAPPSGLHDPPDTHSGSHHSHHPAMSQHHPHHPHPVLMDPSHLGHSRHPLGPPHYGTPAPVVAPLYPSLTTPTQTTHSTHGSGVKRPRPDDLDLSVPGMPDLEQQDLEGMPPSAMGAAYAAAAHQHHHQHQQHQQHQQQQQQQQSQSQHHPPQLPPPPTHHHHRMPDTGPRTKMMRRDGEGGGGAPSMVGQVGMPVPAARPRGPKLKFTPEDDQLLIDLKENKSLTWKQIADFFPGRSSGTLQVRYCTKLKAKTTQWTDETDQKLRAAMQDYENEKWRIIANKVGTGFTPVACRERAAQLSGETL